METFNCEELSSFIEKPKAFIDFIERHLRHLRSDG